MSKLHIQPQYTQNLSEEYCGSSQSAWPALPVSNRSFRAIGQRRNFLQYKTSDLQHRRAVAKLFQTDAELVQL